jgi:hypothetical protein
MQGKGRLLMIRWCFVAWALRVKFKCFQMAAAREKEGEMSTFEDNSDLDAL